MLTCVPLGVKDHVSLTHPEGSGSRSACVLVRRRLSGRLVINSAGLNFWAANVVRTIPCVLFALLESGIAGTGLFYNVKLWYQQVCQMNRSVILGEDVAEG